MVAPTTITVTRTTTLFNDVDGDGKADPGDTLRTHILITNPAAGSPITGIMVTDPANGTTIQPGTVTITPVAADDAYSLSGNTPISFAANAGVLANDFDADSSTPNSNVGVTVSQVNGTAISGSPIAVSNGSVLMAADGSFTFTPATGFIGTTSFTYQITDASGLHAVDTGVVTLTVGADIWYVDGNSATNGDGSYNNPFNTLTSVNGVDHAGDIVVVHNSLSAGGLIMEANETLYGDGSTFIANGHQITNNGANSTINHAAVGVTLATDNVINGVNFVGTANAAIGIQDGGGTVSTPTHNLAITHTAITGQGQIIDIDQGGKVVASFDSLASTGSTGANGGVVDLTGLTTGSSVTVVGTTSITGTHSQAGIDISGNDGTTMDFQGAVTINTGAQTALNVTGNTGTDSISFDAGTKNITTTTATAVNLSGNTTATTVNFTGGGLNINTTSGAGLNLGATTLNVTGGSNTIATTTGQIITAANASVGGSGVTFASLTSTGAVTGHAVSINNLDGNSFSGGTVSIASTTGVDADTTASDGIHIAGGSSTNFSFGSTTIGGTLAVAGDGVDLSGANGTVSFSSVAINNVGGNGVSINGATQTVTISAGTIGDTNDPGADAVNIAGGTGAVTINAAITKTTAGNAVDISGHNSLGSGLGTIAFNGDITSNGTSNGITIDNNVGGAINFTGTNVTLNTGANTALNFTDNQATGAAVTFSGGNLNIDTTSGTGINATSTTPGTPIGSLTISGANNTVDTTAGGAAVNVLGVAETIDLLHVNAAGGSKTAISLDNAGSAAGNHFVVSGSGTSAGTGGVLNFTASGADGATNQGIGVYLNKVGNVTLQDMNFTGTFNNFGIRGDTVNNFTLKDSNLTGTFGTNVGLDEGTIRFGTQAGSTNGLTGTASFLGNNIAGTTIEDGVSIYENVAGSATVNFADTTAHQAIIGGTVANDGIHLESTGSFNLTTTIDGLDFNGAHGDLLQVVAGGSTVQTITIQNNNFHNANATSVGGGVTLGGGGSGSNYNVTFNVNNNDFKGAEGTALGALYLGSAAIVRGIILNNVIGTPNGVLDSGIASRGSNSGNGIEVRSEHINGGGTLDEAYRIEGNQVSDISGTAGIAIRSSSQAGGGTSHVEATVLNNIVKNFGANSTAAFYSNVGGFGDAFGGQPADNATLGLNVIGNTFNSTGATSGQNNAMVLDQTSGSAHYYLPGYGGSPNGELQVYSASPGTASTDITSFMLDATHHNSLTNNPTGPKNVPNLVDASLVFGVTGAAFTTAVPEFAAQAPMQTWEEQSLQDKPVVQPQVNTTAEQNGAGTPGGTTPAGGGTGGSTPPADTPPPPPPSAIVDDSVLTQAKLDFTVSAAIARWAEAGASAAQIAAMKAVSVTIADIAGIQIGGATAGHIMIDSDGAGYGWFVDSTPDGDSEFHGTGSDLLANAGGPAAGKLDLLTVVMHELGHQIGLDDQYQPGQTADVMYGYANPGERRLPTGADVHAASGTAIDHEAFSLSPISAGSLPTNKAVEVSFDATVNAFSPGLVPSFSSTSHVTYTGNSTGVDSNAEPLSTTSTVALDTLTLGDHVFNDANNNHLFDSGEGISGVALTLYAKGTAGSPGTSVDADGDGILDTQVTTTTTGAGGVYSFASLAPGDYIVRVDASNFLSGHALAGLAPVAPADTTPNDNIDNDSNTVDHGGGVIGSNAITLTFNNEPTPGNGNNTNNTLDLGFVANLPPTAVTETLTATEDTDANYTAASLLANDTDPENDTLTVTGVSNPTHGTVSLSAGTITFTPAAGYFGAASFDYTISDGHGHTSTVTDTVNVALVNDAPVNTVGSALAINEDASATAVTGMSVNDPDTMPATDKLTVHLSTLHGALNLRTDVAGGIQAADIIGGGEGLHGITVTATQNQINATLAASNGLTYTPDANYNGADGVTISSYDGLFSTTVSLAVGTNIDTGSGSTPTRIVTGDLNHDGIPDLVYVNSGTDRVAVQLGNGDGTFGAQTLLTAGAGVARVVIADINGDGKQDLVVANFAGDSASGSVGVFFGDGAGGFGAMQTIASGVQSAYDIVTGDFNHDGRMDIAVDRRSVGQVGIILQQAGGTFAAPVYYSTTSTNYTKSIVTGDFNGDGILDIVAINAGSKFTGSPPGTVSLLLGNADGTFQNAATIASVAYTPWDAVVADFNGDGRLDLAFSSITAFKGVTVMLGNGNGTFAAPVQYATPTNAVGLVASDVNGDGLPDLVAATQGSPGSVATFVNNGNGTFQAAVLTAAGTDPESVVAGNFDGDGDTDLVVANQTSNNLTFFANATDRLGNVDTKTVNIAPVNDAPSGADTTKPIVEDTPYTFAASDFGFTDPVEGNAFQAVKITTLPTGGTLTLGGNPVSAGDVVPVGQIGTLVFTPTQNLNGTGAGHFTFQVQDNGGTANGGVDTDPTPNNFTFDISAVNDAPVNHVPGAQSVNEDTSLAFTGGNAISVSDVDAGAGTITVDLGVLHGTLALTASGAAVVTGSGTGTAHVSGTLTDVNATLASLAYQGAANYHGPDTLTIGTSDNGNSGSGGTLTDSDTVAITVNAVNDTPVLSASPPVTTNEQTAVTLDPAMSVHDVDLDAFNAGAGDYAGAKLNVANNSGTTTADDHFTIVNGTDFHVSGSQLLDSANHEFATFTGGNGTPLVITFTSAATPATTALVNEVAQSIQYTNGSDSPPSSVDISVSLNDGDFTSGNQGAEPTPSFIDSIGSDVVTVNITPVNDPPTADNATAMGNEDTTLVLTTSDFTQSYSDPEGNAFAGIKVASLPSHGQLLFDADGAGGNPPAAVAAGDTISAADIAAGKLTYTPELNGNGNPLDSFKFQVMDNGGTANGGTNTSTAQYFLYFDISPINDKPVLSASPAVTTNEQTAVTLDPAMSVHDVDLDAFNGGAGNYAGAKLNIANNSGTTTADDHFTIANGAAFHVTGNQLLDSANHEFATFSGGNGTPLVVTFTSAGTPATTALVNDVAQHLQYTNGSDTPPGSIDVSVSLNDGNFTLNNQGSQPGNSPFASIGNDVVHVNITAVNDPPVVDLNGAAAGTSSSINFTEGDPATKLAPSATVTDPDLPTNFGGGTLTVSFTANGTPDDMLVVIDQGGVGGHITTDESSLYYDGNFIGSYYGGQDGSSPLVVTFTADATPAMVQAVVEDIGFANGSAAPSTLDRTVTFSLTDGQGGTSNPVTATVHLTAVDTPGIATDDFASTPENAPVVINVLANDQDPDGGPATNISAINGMAIAVGGHVTLASGATVTLNSDNTLTYNPNGKFNSLTSPNGGESGAVNTQADENFTYTLSGGGSGTANVKVTVVGVASPDDRLQGDSNDNVITGTPGPDFFDLRQGGDDTVSGLGGNDIFYFGSALTVADKVDGGPGADQIALQGNYPALTLGTGVINVESLYLMAGSDTRLGDTAGNFYSYNITTVDQNIAAGQQLTIDGSALRPGENLTVNASAETDGNVWIYGGAGVDALTGGAKNDVFLFGEGRFGPSDHVDGGAGIDQLALRGNYTLTFGATQMTSIESLYLMSAADTRVGVPGTTFSYNLTMNDGNVAAGQQLTVDASALRSNETLTFNGSAETNGTFRIFGGQGNDHIVGGQGNDILTGGLGADYLKGGPGADIYNFRSAAESTSTTYDVIDGFDPNVDRIHLPGTVTGWSPTMSHGQLNNATFDADLAAALDGTLNPNTAMLFTPTTGDNAGKTFLIFDADGDGSYQAGHDYVIQIINPAHPITTTDTHFFI